PRPRPRRLADDVRDDTAGVPGLADDRRDRADGGPRRRDASQAASVDDGRTGESRAAPGPGRVLPADGRRRHPGLYRGGRHRRSWPDGVAHRAAVSPAVGGVADGRSLEQPAVAGRAHEGAVGRGGARAQADRAPHLALLHDVRRRRRPRVASRQFPGGSAPCRRPPDVADEPGALPAGHGGGARLRLARGRGHRRAARGDASDDAATRALSRPLLQLVRHAGSAPARSPLRLVGRQRQPRGSSHHPRPGVSRDDHPAAARRGAGRHRGRRVTGPRIARRAGGSDGTLDPGRYDLLASEARLTSFLTIARGDVPVSHWFRLGRALTPVESDSVLVSWSGSMFEYLMPALVMRVPAGSLLAQTGELVVARQISYGAERGVPWGVSESSYNVRDLEMTYQYSNFGVPGLGLRFGLVDDVVIAPYAATPRTHLLSNGRYAVMMTAAGSGYSRFKGLAVTRWRDDVTRDAAGTYVFLRNVQTGETWSAGYQPTARAPDRYEVRFAEDRV